MYNPEISEGAKVLARFPDEHPIFGYVEEKYSSLTWVVIVTTLPRYHLEFMDAVLGFNSEPQWYLPTLELGKRN